MTPAPYRVSSEPAPTTPPHEDRLGPRRSVHPLGLGTHTADILLGGAVALLLSILGPLLAGWKGLAITLPMSLAGLAITLIPALWRRGIQVELHRDGLAVAGPAGRDVAVFEDVDEVWYELHRARVGLTELALIKAMRLVEHGGRAHRVPLDMEGGLEIGRAIVRRCSSPLIAEARSAIEAGEMLTFGPVQLDKSGITIRAARCAWSELTLVRRQPFRTIFFREQRWWPWRTVRLDKIPHPLVFGHLVASLAPGIEDDDPILYSDA